LTCSGRVVLAWATMATTPGTTFRAERTENEVVVRLPSPNRLLRAFLPDDAVKHLYAAQREQLLALPGVRQTRTFFVMKEVVDNAPLDF